MALDREANGSGPMVHRADIVIVGAGAAGAMAALAATEQGASFVGLDQLPEFGGTAIVSGGGMSIARHQHAGRARYRGLAGSRLSRHGGPANRGG